MMAARVEIPHLPAWLSILPLLGGSGRASDVDGQFHLALTAAAAALEGDAERRDSRSRLCFLLCELASQFARRMGDPARPIPVSRSQLARASGISLPRVKRVVGFLALAGIIDRQAEGIRVLDWNQLCKLGKYDRAWTMVPVTDEEEFSGAVGMRPDEDDRPRLTAAGEPACFS